MKKSMIPVVNIFRFEFYKGGLRDKSKKKQKRIQYHSFNPYGNFRNTNSFFFSLVHQNLEAFRSNIDCLDFGVREIAIIRTKIVSNDFVWLNKLPRFSILFQYEFHIGAHESYHRSRISLQSSDRCNVLYVRSRRFETQKRIICRFKQLDDLTSNSY